MQFKLQRPEYTFYDEHVFNSGIKISLDEKKNIIYI